MRRLACVLLALAFPVFAEPASYRIDSGHTRAEFVVAHLGMLRAHGRFEQVSGRLAFDPVAHVGSIELEISASSVATGWESRDEFIRGATMFDSAQYPRMRFRSTRFEFDHDRLVRVDGELTLRDVTRPVSLEVTRIECGRPASDRRDGCTAVASGTIRRREFAMDAWWPLIGDEVELRIDLVAVRD